MILVQNFTEFYNILKTHNGIPNSVSKLKEYVLLVERFKNTCSCRGTEKQRVKNECESQYRLLVITEVSNHINLFKNSLGDGNIKFIQNNVIIQEFNV
jgi:hypothetical protein